MMWPYWHTPQDTIDKISPKTLGDCRHTILESVKELQKKYRFVSSGFSWPAGKQGREAFQRHNAILPAP